MNQLIRNWLDCCNDLSDARNKASAAEEAAEKAELPASLRPAEPRDIVEGAILWYPSGVYNDYDFWQYVSEVHSPDSPWKAYTANDGSRYGLDGAFVEVEIEIEVLAIYQCRIKQRPEYNGKKLMDSCKAWEGKEIELQAMWCMDDDDPYPDEWAMGGVDSCRELLDLAGISWIASGDIEILSVKERGL